MTIDAAQRHGVDPATALAMVHQESDYGKNIVGQLGERGPFQIMPATAKQIVQWHNATSDEKWTTDRVLNDAPTNIDAGLYYYKTLLTRTGNEGQALKLYNGSNAYVTAVLNKKPAEAAALASGPSVASAADERAARAAVEQKRAAMQAGTNGGAPLGRSAEQEAGSRNGTSGGTTAIPAPSAAAIPASSSALPASSFTPPAWTGAPEGQGIAAGERGLEYGGGAPSYKATRQSDAAFVQSLVNKPRGGPFEGIGTIPLLIGLIAAANGQFGPLAAMMEQTRKTQQAATMQPLLTEISRRQGAGDYAGALQLGEMGFGALEGRAPEAAKDLSTTLQSIRKNRNDLQTVRQTLQGMEEGGSMTSMNPYYRQLKAIQTMADKGDIGSAAAALNLLNETKNIQVQTGPVATRFIAPGTQQVVTIANQQMFDPEQNKGLAWETTLGKLKLTPDQATKILTHQVGPVLNADGVDMNTPEGDNQLRTLLANNRAFQARIEQASKIPLSDADAEVAGKMGIPQERILTRDFTPEEWKVLFDARAEASQMAQTGIFRAKREEWPKTPSAQLPDQAIIDPLTGQERMMWTPNDMQAHADAADKEQGQLVQRTNLPQIYKLTQLRNRLNQLETILNDPGMADISDPIGGFRQKLVGEANRRFPLSDEVSVRQSMQDLASGPLQAFLNESKQGKQYQGALNTLLNDNIRKDVAIKQLGILRNAIQDDLNMYSVMAAPGIPAQSAPPGPAETTIVKGTKIH